MYGEVSFFARVTECLFTGVVKVLAQVRVWRVGPLRIVERREGMHGPWETVSWHLTAKGATAAFERRVCVEKQTH